MGTDIHGFVEHKVDGKWRLVAVETTCSWCKGSGLDKENNGPCYNCCVGKRRPQTKGKQIGYGDRNYFLFSILNNIRNYPPIQPIADRRGLPDDVSDELKYIQYHGDDSGKYWEYDLGDHSVSWVNLSELLAYDWNQTVPERGKLVTHAEVVGHFYTHFIPALKALDEDPNNVRLVFGFDS